MVADLSKPITSYQRDKNQPKKNLYLLDNYKKQYQDSLGVSSASTLPYSSMITKSTPPISPIKTSFRAPSNRDLSQTEKLLRTINTENSRETLPRHHTLPLEQSFEAQMNLDGCISVVVK
jgi:hypothetical protein